MRAASLSAPARHALPRYVASHAAAHGGRRTGRTAPPGGLSLATTAYSQTEQFTQYP